MTLLVKISLVGDQKVGKRTFLEKFCRRPPIQYPKSGIHDYYALKECTIDGEQLKFQIWCLTELDDEVTMSEKILGSLGGIIMFDLSGSRKEVFDRLDYWLNQLWTHNDKGKIPIILIGNKKDLREDNPETISDELIHDYCSKLNEQIKSTKFKIHFYSISSIIQTNVDHIFKPLCQYYFESLDKNKLN